MCYFGNMAKDTSTPWQGRARQRMQQLGLTQKNVADAMDVGDASTVSRWLSGQRELSAERAVKLAEVLRCSVEWLLTGRETASEGPLERRIAALPPNTRKCLLRVLEAFERDLPGR